MQIKPLRPSKSAEHPIRRNPGSQRSFWAFVAFGVKLCCLFIGRRDFGPPRDGLSVHSHRWLDRPNRASSSPEVRTQGTFIARGVDTTNLRRNGVGTRAAKKSRIFSQRGLAVLMSQVGQNRSRRMSATLPSQLIRGDLIVLTIGGSTTTIPHASASRTPEKASVIEVRPLLPFQISTTHSR